jgi:hypothetical protein
MYSITADGVDLYRSSDVALIRHMFRQYQALYAWSLVRLQRVRV